MRNLVTVTTYCYQSPMGTIVKRGDSYRAIVRKKGHTPITKSFSRRTLAKAWIANTEVALEKKEQGSKSDVVGKLIERYIEEVGPIRRLAKDTLKALRYLGKTTLKLTLDDLSAPTLMVWREKNCANASPASVSRYLSRMATVFATAEALWDVVVPWREFRIARTQLRTLGIIAAGRSRERRFEPGEVDAIKAGVGSTLPICDIIDFALVTALRSAEITRVRWLDINREKRTLLIRDRKHPTKKIGNTMTIPLLGNALEIIDRQTQGENEFIFPYNSQSVEAAFRRAVKIAGIKDLRFHDLRHEAISRLFEMGYKVQEVALVSGHSSWNSLKIYTNLKPESLHRD